MTEILNQLISITEALNRAADDLCNLDRQLNFVTQAALKKFEETRLPLANEPTTIPQFASVEEAIASASRGRSPFLIVPPPIDDITTFDISSSLETCPRAEFKQPPADSPVVRYTK